MMEEDRSGAWVGGWDGAATEGSSVLLIREGLTGTLSAAHLMGEELEYQITYDLEGDPTEDPDSILFSLACAEVEMRSLTAQPDPNADPNADPNDPTADPDPNDSTANGEPADATDPAAEASWAALDCAGWELELRCGLAGECGVGDCNMLCDVVYFGDAYASAKVPLTVVEDEFDHWQRV